MSSEFAHDLEMNFNAVGFCWIAGGTICVVIWWNKDGFTGLIGDDGTPIYGCMQAQIATIPGINQENDINMAIDWGHFIDLDIATYMIDRYGAWIKPSKLEWRPRVETNSPLRLRIKK